MNARKPDPMIHLARGMELHRHGRIPEAVEAYQKALQIAPGLHAALKYQGLALFQMGLREPGLAMMGRAATQLPDDASAHFNLGQALCSVGRDREGLAAFTRAAQIDPDDTDAAGVAASLAERLGERAQAIALWQGAVCAKPEFAEGWDELSRLCYLDNQVDAAVDAHRRALTLDPSVIERRLIGYADPDPTQTRPTVMLPLNAARHPSMAQREALDQFTSDAGLTIIDDLLRHPLGYREHALEQDFRAEANAGRNGHDLQTPACDPKEVMTVIASTLGRRVKWISPDNGVYRLSYADTTARTEIQIDNDADDEHDCFTAVLYLNLPGQEQGGTTFWRHRPTGWTHRVPDGELKRSGFASFKDFQDRCLPNAASRKSKAPTALREDWEPIVELSMKNNRLVLYRGSFFHSLSSVFGSTPQDGRLVQLFFFEPA